MPDYNAAVAAGIQPPQPVAQQNFGNTLSTVADFQRAQAAAQLSQLQALQVQRQYNGLMAFQQALTHDPSNVQGAYQAGVAGGANMSDLKGGLEAYSTSRFMQGHNNQDPNAALASAGIAEKGAQIGNLVAARPGIGAESDTKVLGGSAQVANQYVANPSPENYQAMVDFTKKYKGPLAAAQVAQITDPDKRMALAKGHIGGGLNAEQATKLEQTEPGRGTTSPLERLAPPAGLPPSSQAGQAQTAPLNQAPTIGVLGGRPTPSLGANEMQKGGAAQNLGDLKEANEKYHNASEVQSGLMQIQNNLDNVPQGGWYTTGTDAGKRVALAKGINTALQAGGLDAPFDKNAIASAEAAQKGTVKLGFDLARSLGSREAQMIVQQSIGVQPGMEMTEQGNRRIMTGLMTAAQRDKDYTQFFQSYAKQNPGMTPGEAQVAFNQAHPPSEYVGNVNKILSLPSAAVKDLRDNPKLAPMFDAKFGGGERLSRFVLGN